MYALQATCLPLSKQAHFMGFAALMGRSGLLCSATATISIHLNVYNDALNANAAIVSNSTQAKELVTEPRHRKRDSFSICRYYLALSSQIRNNSRYRMQKRHSNTGITHTHASTHRSCCDTEFYSSISNVLLLSSYHQLNESVEKEKGSHSS